jgi:hypothetical protein
MANDNDDERKARDRALCREHDPLYPREIELKLDLLGSGDVLAEGEALELRLKQGKTDPFVTFPFGRAVRGRQHYVFVQRDRSGRMAGTFVVIRAGDLFWVREKSGSVIPAARQGSLESFVLVREEIQDETPVRSLAAFLAFLGERSAGGRTKVEFAGLYTRDRYTFGCHDVDSDHRYVVGVDRCGAGDGRELRQLEIEYVWKRARPVRPVELHDVLRDMAELARQIDLAHRLGGSSVLRPSRQTKIEWFLEGRNDGPGGPLDPA